MRRVIGSSTRAFLTALTVAMVAGATYAVAASSGGKTIHACVKPHTGIVFLGKCGKHTRALTWNTAGPQGQNGQNGQNGLNGAAGATGPAGSAGKSGV